MGRCSTRTSVPWAGGSRRRSCASATSSSSSCLRRTTTMTEDALADGLELGEAPRVDEQGRVWFTNVLGGGVYRWSAGAGIETMVPKRKGVGGLALHEDGGVVVSGRDIVHVQ